jgi:uncharacterized protein (DUF58 family)
VSIAPASLRQSAEALAAPLPPLLAAAAHLAASALPGAHGRRRAGTGDEFWQFRPAAGASGRIDWRRSGRGDEVFVRQTEWQAARSVNLWVDGGQAMDFTSERNRATKGAHARLLAMALGLLLLRGGERVGLAHPDYPPRAGQAQAARVAQGLSVAAESAEHTAPDLSQAPIGGVALLFSDFLGDLDAVEVALGQAAQRHLRGALVQVLDPAEEGFPFDGRTRFESMSGHLSFETLRAGDLRAAYMERLAQRRDRLSQLARHAGWDFATVHTATPASVGLLWLYNLVGGGR